MLISVSSNRQNLFFLKHSFIRQEPGLALSFSGPYSNSIKTDLNINVFSYLSVELFIL